MISLSPAFCIVPDWPEETCINIIIKLYPSRAIQFHLLKRLPDDIIRLSFGLLRRFDHSSLVDIAFVVDIEFPKCLL